MSDQPGHPRPPQVTVAGWLIMVGSVFVVLMVWDRLTGLQSLESRRALQSFLDDPLGKQLGLQLGELRTLVRTVSMVAAGCATAMAILGWQVLQRSHSARIALTVLAVPLFFSGLVTGSFVASGVAAATASLWLRPARRWFGGLPQELRERDPGSPLRREQQPSQPPGQPPSQPPGQSGQHPSPFAGWQPPETSSYDATQRRDPSPTTRPQPLVWAALATWFFAGLATVIGTVALATLAADSGEVVRRMHEMNPDLDQQGLGDHAILTISYVSCSVVVVWSLLAAAFAVFAFHHATWAWYALVVSTVCVAGVCLLGAVGSLLALVPLAAAVATVGLLAQPEVRRWFGIGS